MANKYECLNCSRVFNPNNYSFCPNCKVQVPSKAETRNAPIAAPQKVDQSSNPSSELTIAELEFLHAQNRTTHAVRSLAISFVAAPIISIAIIIAVVIASASGSSALIILTGTLGGIIVISTLVVSLAELAKSKIN